MNYLNEFIISINQSQLMNQHSSSTDNSKILNRFNNILGKKVENISNPKIGFLGRTNISNQVKNKQSKSVLYNQIKHKQSNNNKLRQITQQQQSLSKCSSNNSFIQNLDNENMKIDESCNKNVTEDIQMIKICDGVYMGGQNSIWDIQTMSLNYITHVILISSPYDQLGSNQTKFVPQIVQYTHSVIYDFKILPENIDLTQIFEKIVKFVQHSHQLGQSCVFIYKSNNSECQYNIFKNINKSAIIVCGYLMQRYKWSMLKAAQFITSRFNASFFTAQTLNRINQNKISNSHNHSATQYSKNLMAHLIPQLPLPTNNYNLIQFSKNLASLFPYLNLLQSNLLAQKKYLSFGWQKNERILNKQNLQRQVQIEQQLVLTNTFLNSIVGSQLRFNYLRLLSSTQSHQNLPNLNKNKNNKISRQHNKISRQHNKSSRQHNKSSRQHNKSSRQHNKRSMKVLSIDMNNQTKHGNIRIKHTQIVDRINKQQIRTQDNHKNNLEKTNGCLKTTNKIIKNKKVSWRQKIIQDQLQILIPKIERAVTQSSHKFNNFIGKQNSCYFVKNKAMPFKKDNTLINIKNGCLKPKDLKQKIKINVIEIMNNRNKENDKTITKNNGLARKKSIAKLQTLLDQRLQDINQSISIQQTKINENSRYSLRLQSKTQGQLTEIRNQNKSIDLIEIDMIYSEGNHTNCLRSNRLHNISQKQNNNNFNNFYNTQKIAFKNKQRNKQKLIHATIEELKKISLRTNNKIRNPNQKIF